MGESFITEDGEAIEGESLEDVIVVGRVTYFVNRAGEDDCPMLSEMMCTYWCTLFLFKE
jgi:hypothetical protein